MHVSVADLRKVTNCLFDHLDSIGISEVDIPGDFYWDIPKQERRDVYKDPTGLTTGQFSDDWHELQMILSGEGEPIAFAFVWLSALLREIGDEIVR